MLFRRIALVLLLGALGGCTSAPDTAGPLPDGGSLVAASADALRDLRSVSFEFAVSGAIPGLAVREVTGEAARGEGAHGFAHGDVDVQHTDERAQYEFRVDGGTLYLTGSDDEHTEQPVPAGFDPARLLDPEDGLRSLLTGATNLRTESREKLGEVATYRVTGELPEHVVSALVPGIRSDAHVKFWVAEAAGRHLRRIWIQVPPRQPNEGAVTLELALSDHNAPVEPTPPS
ncbi:LppX_LprAFG lipoprotein [Qaidamihabitans albus]|uniref:LppX_LprAFG lipoprotein n=1 Tax=Qaidamihabitans albus TaxID=2795733 RepID=UPI0018F1F4E5|nr:LppX_LprAFG lipoprotein [Qaidamihabitans albus]